MSAKSPKPMIIEALAAKFQDAWNGGTPPRLEDYLAEVPLESRASLLVELLDIEVGVRLQRQEPIDKNEYIQRFNQFSDIVNERLSEKLLHESATLSFAGSTTGWKRLGLYDLIEPLGQGGMGSVYKARHIRLKKIVALKVVSTEQRSLARFQHEMEIIGRLNHPNIVQATDAGDSGGVHYLVMEYVNGITLLKLIKMHPVLPVDVSCHIARQVAAALAHIHKHELVHRDIKPSNIMVTQSGQVKLLDLGLARLTDKLLNQDQLTRQGDLLGTLDYMAPEQCDDPQGVDIRADVYGLGCTLFHLLTGRPPYFEAGSTTVIKKIMAHARAPIPSALALRPDLPEGIEQLLERMLAKQPQDRYTNPADLMEALEAFTQPTTAASCRVLASAACQAASPDHSDVALLDVTADTAHTTAATGRQNPPSLTGLPDSEPIVPCPYPGLRAFSRDESHLFFGREEHLEQLLEKVAAHRFLAVVGPSGCGKSSLVTAGLMAMFEGGFIQDAGPNWREAVMRPGEAPFERLANSLLDARALGPERGSGELAAGTLEATLRRGNWGLVDALNETGLPEGTNLVLLVDQFEEIFRYREICQTESRHGANDAQAFVDLLLTSTQPPAKSDGRLDSVRVYVIITMRWDFLDDHFHFAGLTDALNRSVFFTPRLTRDQLRAAIVGPARCFDSDVEAVLVNRLLNDTATDADQLPLMQHTLMRMWLQEARQIRHAPGGAKAPKLTLAAYQKIGNAGQALSKHADEKLLSGSPRQQYIARKTFQWLCERSTGNRDTRRPITLGEVAKVADATPAEVASVVEIFRSPDCCLLMPPVGVSLEPTTILDISHECVIRKWQRLQEWLESEAADAAIYKNLLLEARQWQRDGRPCTPAELDRALAWLESAKPNETWALRYGGDFALVEQYLQTPGSASGVRQRSGSAARPRDDYDVMLYYHADDRNAVRAIAERLQAAGIRPWFDEWDLPPGRSLENELIRQIDRIAAAAICVGPTGRVKSQELSLRGLMSAFLDRNCAVIPVILEGVDGDLPPFLQNFSVVDFRRTQPDPVKSLVWGITGQRPE